jgi:hypothetical protein
LWSRWLIFWGFKATVHGSIYMTIPSSISWLLDSSLPPCSSQSSNCSLYVASPHTSPDIHGADWLNDSSNRLESSLTRHPQSLSPLEDLLVSPKELRLSGFLSAGNNADSMGWPPIESALFHADENAEQGDGTGTRVQVSDVSL